IVSRRSKHFRFAKRVRAPQFASRGRMVLASAQSRMTVAPESALARRFRGFINPHPMAQKAFEALRKPHLVAINLEPPAGLPAGNAAAVEVAEAPAEPQTAAPITTVKQDRAVPKPVIELASAESKLVTLSEPAPTKPALIAAANAAPAAPQAIMS